MSENQSLQTLDSTSRWIIHNAPKIDVAWEFQQTIEKRRLPPPSPNIEQRKTRFNVFMGRYFSRCKDRDAHKIFQNANTWEAVRKEAEMALDKYENRGKSWRNPLRRSIRLVGGVSSRLEFLTVLIPSGDYLGVLCGGLTLVYNAANRQRELTTLIVESLGVLTEEMNHAQSYIRDYAWNPELLRATEDLYMAILDAIEAIVDWIAKFQGRFREVWQAGKAFFQQGEYGESLEDSITTDVKIKVEAFDRIVEKCLHREVRDISQNVYQAGQTLDVVDGKIEENTGHLKKVHAALYTVEDVIRGIAKDFDSHRAELAARERLFEQRQQEFQVINEQRFNQLQQYEFALACSAAVIRSQLQQQPRQTIRISQLLAALNLTELDPKLDAADQVVETIAREREVILFFGRTLDSRVQNKIATVMQNPDFESWLKGLKSRALIISGMDMNALQSDVVSPLSYMCAALARTVAEIQYAHPIAFFCRLHSDTANKLHGATGMMRSLIAQLALFCVETTPDLLSFLTPADLDTIKACTLSDLCRLFDNLVKAVGSGVIICMIDGVNFFENEMCLKEMNQAMRFLNSILEAVGAAQSGLVLKLLVTSPTASENCRYWFPNRVDLFMPREFLLDGQGFDGLGMPMF